MMSGSDNRRAGVDSANAAKLTANIKAAGCAAKIGAAQLHDIVKGLPEFSSPQLLTSIGSFEDAAVYKLAEDLAIVQTIDFFPPVVDDPFTFGRIAAVNALSDIYAMGARPLLALSVLCFPTCDLPLSAAADIVAGGAAAVKAAGALLVGGHSIQGHEPIFGLAVTGVIDPKKMLTNSGAQEGDALVITKRLGTGVALLALKGNLLDNAFTKQLIDQLTALNAQALAIASKFDLHAATDVTGFGLIGHGHEMARGAGLKLVLSAAAVPLLAGVEALAEQGFVPAGAYGNRQSYQMIASISDQVELALADLLFDPQTSGGLLFALPAQEAQALVKELHAQGIVGAIIGRFERGVAGQVEVV